MTAVRGNYNNDFNRNIFSDILDACKCEICDSKFVSSLCLELGSAVGIIVLNAWELSITQL